MPNTATSYGSKNLNKEEIKEKMREHVNNKILVIDDIDRQIFELVSIVP